jgi:trimethylamine--corrinoid protein Co-methyltransferase
MKAKLQVLSEDERVKIHERTLKILANTGMQVETKKGRNILKKAGAKVDENQKIVRFPRQLIEDSLKASSKNFTLGARRQGWDLEINVGNCYFCGDGEAANVVDPKTGERRPGTFDDWLKPTIILDYADDLSVYWPLVVRSDLGKEKTDFVRFRSTLHRNFSKHVNDAVEHPREVPWFLEIIQTIFGDKNKIRKEHPVSYLLNSQSPLIIEEQHTDAYLEMLDYDFPVAVMPMPMMGASSPASMISTILMGNCEALGYLCLIQAAAPGTPFIYAPVPILIDPRNGRYTSGSVEVGLFASAVTEMGRYYGLPVMAAGTGTDQHFPDIQTGYEKASNGLLAALSWPDILLGPGLTASQLDMCLEQIIIDLEVFRLNKKARQGFDSSNEKWLDDVIEKVGPGGNFVGEKTTRSGARSGEWYLSNFGMHDTFEEWDRAGRPQLLDQAREEVERILSTHKPLPLGEDIERELKKIEEKARESLEK